MVQEAIGRAQGFEFTREAVGLVRAAGVAGVDMDLIYGLPHQTRARLCSTVEKVLALSPDRLTLTGYAHVPWMAKRQMMIPTGSLPRAEERLDLFEASARILEWDGYEPLGIDHFARPADPLAVAARERRMRRTFQGYAEDGWEVLIGLGASAISHYPQGYAQNAPTSSAYVAAIRKGLLAAERGHALTADDRLRADLIEGLMCRFEIDLAAVAVAHGLTQAQLLPVLAGLRHRFGDWIEIRRGVLRLARAPRLIARLAAREIDAYAQAEGRHSRAV